MGAIIGVLLGYWLGTRAGPEGWTEVEDAWRVIVTSDEVRDLVGGGIAIARELLGRTSEDLREALKEGNGRPALHPVA